VISKHPLHPFHPARGGLRLLPAAALLAAIGLLQPVPPARSAELLDVYLVSSYDSLTVHSKVMIPTNYDSLTPTPVLFTFHGVMAPNGNSILRQYMPSADARGWIIGSPDMHGENNPTGQFSFGARAAQHDVIDLLQYLRENYNIDDDRLYLSGPSMGGQMTSIMAEKYPHVFAGAVEWMGPADLSMMHREMIKEEKYWISDGVEQELGGLPDEVPYEYDRRSPWMMAMNLKDVPFAIGHGANDEVIHPQHATFLARTIQDYDPSAFYGIYWHDGSHEFNAEHVEWTCAFLEGHTRPPVPEDLYLWVDESKDYYYADIVQADPGTWSKFKVDVTPPDSLVTLSVNVSDMTIHADQTRLDTNGDMALTIHHTGMSTFTVSGLVDSTNYVLYQEGVEYGDYTYDAGVLTLTLPEGSPSPVSFLLRPMAP
jgi:predicted esterase